MRCIPAMQDRPLITTAIPKRRYQLGDHGATLLGEITSGDTRRFRFILAFVPNGAAAPVAYVCAEEAPGDDPEGRYRLLIINEVMTEVLDTGDCWGEEETFAAQALEVGAQILGLQQESVVRLL